MRVRQNTKIDTMTIRELFDSQLSSAGVDCFAIFSEDLWQPNRLIPQDLDTALFYPEATYAAPDSAFHEDTISRLVPSLLIDGINCAFLENSAMGPAVPIRNIVSAIYDEYDPLFQPFLRRERVESTAIFSPRTPLISGNTLTELLFLNFRRAQSFIPERQFELTSLAQAILNYVPSLCASRNRRAYGPATKTIRAFSCLIQSLNQQLRNPAVAPDDKNYNKIAKELHDVLALETEQHRDSATKPNLIISFYLMRMPIASDTRGRATAMVSEYKFEPYLMLRGSSIGDRHTKKTQQLYDSSAASVTVCATIANAPHVLQHVDPYVTYADGTRHVHETSIELTYAQLGVAKLDVETFKVVSCAELKRMRATVRAGEADRGSISRWCVLIDEGGVELTQQHGMPRRPRLILWTPGGSQPRDLAADRDTLIQTLVRTDLGKRWPWLIEKVKARSRVQFAHIFGELDKEWALPSSEVCVPIRFAGQSIGCVNIESSLPDRFNFTYVGLLSSFAAVVGLMAARELDLKLSEMMQSVLRAIHSHEFIPDGTEILSAEGKIEGYKSQIIDDQYQLNELAWALAQACWAERCYFISTGAHEDDPIRFLGTSDAGWHDSAECQWRLPREDGLNAWLARQPEDIVGVVIDTDDSRQDALLVRKRGAQFEFDESSPPVDLPRNRDHGSRSARRLVFCRLSSFGSQQRPSHFSRSIIILAYDRKMFALRAPDAPRAATRRSEFLTYVYSLCQRCSGVADHWNSSLLERLTVQENVAHGSDFLAIERGWTTLQSLTPLDDRIDRIHILLRNAWVCQKVAAFLSSRTGRLTADLPAFDRHNLASLTAEAVRSAGAIVKSFHICETSVAEAIATKTLPPSEAVLFFYLVGQTLVNAREHAKIIEDGRIKKIEIQILHKTSGEHDLPGILPRITCRIQDNGIGFPPTALAEYVEFRRRLPGLIAGRRGRGLDLMARAARRLNPSAPAGEALRLGNVGTGGAYVEFDLLQSCLLG